MMCLEDTWFVAAFHSYKSAAPPEALAHSGIWLGLWADASGDAAQSASMFILKRQSRALGPGIGCFRELSEGLQSPAAAQLSSPVDLAPSGALPAIAVAHGPSWTP